MSYVYAYASDADDFSTIGLVGGLLPTSCKFKIDAGSFGELTIEHPKDEHGKWRALTDGTIIKAAVPNRLPPNITAEGTYISKVERWVISTTATKKERELYRKEDGKSKSGNVNPGQEVTFVKASLKGNFVNIKYTVGEGRRARTYTGWVNEKILETKIEEVTTPATSAGAEEANRSYAIQYQLFRIYNTTVEDKNGGSVTAKARRIPYDLMGNVTTYENAEPVDCRTVCSGVLNGCVSSHDFKVFSDIGDTRGGAKYANSNPINALLDEGEGVVARWNAQVVNDDFDIYVLHRAGMDRGVRIEYAKNLTGIKCDIDTTNVAVGIRPKGSKKDGEALYLDGAFVDGKYQYGYVTRTKKYTYELAEGYSFDSTGTIIYKNDVKNAYAIPKIAAKDVSEAKIADDVPQELAMERMVQAAISDFEGGGAEPKVTLTVQFIMLGDTEEYSQFRKLESLFVYDTVAIRHKPLGIDSDITCVTLEWDCLLDRATAATFGALEDVTASVASWQISTSSVGMAQVTNVIADGSIGYATLSTGCKASITDASIAAVLSAIRDSGSDIAQAIKALIPTTTE